METLKSRLKGAEEIVEVIKAFPFFFSHTMTTFAEIINVTL